MSKQLTPKELAEILEISAKTLRAYLRKNHERTLEEKCSAWVLDAKTVKSCTARFTKSSTK